MKTVFAVSSRCGVEMDDPELFVTKEEAWKYAKDTLADIIHDSLASELMTAGIAGDDGSFVSEEVIDWAKENDLITEYEDSIAFTYDDDWSEYKVTECDLPGNWELMKIGEASEKEMEILSKFLISEPDIDEDDLFAVIQSHCGHEYVYIFDSKGLKKYCPGYEDFEDKLLKGEVIREDISWPIGGSNSSSTTLFKFEDLSTTEIFLLSKPDGPDSEDPTLIDIAEYIRSVDTSEEGSITKKVLEKLDIPVEFLSRLDPRFDELLKAGITSEDIYGKLKNKRYSEVIK